MSTECTRLNNQRKLGSKGGSEDALKANKVGIKTMANKKDRERVIAEITLSQLIRLSDEQGCPVSRPQALAFLNQEVLLRFLSTTAYRMLGHHPVRSS